MIFQTILKSNNKYFILLQKQQKQEIMKQNQLLLRKQRKGKKGKMNDVKLVIGKATFKGSLTKKERQKLITAQIEQVLERNIWKLQYKLYVTQGWSQIMQYMQSAECQRIDLHNNQFPSILKSLSLPCFTNIVTLVLQKNRIQSVEALTFLNMETINFLDLDDNSITTLKPFDKLNWPFLRKLQIRNNFIQKFQFTRMKTRKYLQKFYMDEMFDRNIMTQDISFLLKLQADRLDNLQIQSKHRMKQSFIFQVLQSKYQTIEISHWALYESDDEQEENDEQLIFEPVTPV